MWAILLRLHAIFIQLTQYKHYKYRSRFTRVTVTYTMACFHGPHGVPYCSTLIIIDKNPTWEPRHSIRHLLCSCCVQDWRLMMPPSEQHWWHYDEHDQASQHEQHQPPAPTIHRCAAWYHRTTTDFTIYLSVGCLYWLSLSVTRPLWWINVFNNSQQCRIIEDKWLNAKKMLWICHGSNWPKMTLNSMLLIHKITNLAGTLVCWLTITSTVHNAKDKAKSSLILIG